MMRERQHLASIEKWVLSSARHEETWHAWNVDQMLKYPSTKTWNMKDTRCIHEPSKPRSKKKRKGILPRPFPNSILTYPNQPDPSDLPLDISASPPNNLHELSCNPILSDLMGLPVGVLSISMDLFEVRRGVGCMLRSYVILEIRWFRHRNRMRGSELDVGGVRSCTWSSACFHYSSTLGHA